MATTPARRWWRAAGATTWSTQYSRACTIGQRSRAAGSSATAPRAVAATLKGLIAPHALGPPSADRAVTNSVSRTRPVGEAGPLFLSAPRLVLGDEIGRAAAGPEREREQQQGDDTDAVPEHGAATMQAEG